MKDTSGYSVQHSQNDVHITEYLVMFCFCKQQEIIYENVNKFGELTGLHATL